MTDEPFTDKHREAIVRQRAEQAVQLGRGANGKILTPQEIVLAGTLAKGGTIIVMASEGKELHEKLGTDNLPKTVEDIKKAEVKECDRYTGGN
jgi:hydrogenase maturation factor